MSNLIVRTFWLPKAGNTDTEYEDAAACSRRRTTRAPFRCAVADGATEAPNSGLWARLVVDAHLHGGFDGSRREATIRALQAQWESTTSQPVRTWYEEEMSERGAFSAFVGLTFRKSRSGCHWRAAAIGDCCLFHIRQERLLQSFPMTCAEAFDSRPHLLPSRPQFLERALSRFVECEGTWRAGDSFILASDALAAWLLSGGANPGRRLQDALQLQNSHTFASWIQDARQGNSGRSRLRNDDVTLLSVRTLRRIPIPACHPRRGNRPRPTDFPPQKFKR